MDKAEALLPCPFCGCADLHGFTHHGGEESYGFQCTECWMTGPQFDSRAEAVAAWNTRAPPLEVVERERDEAQRMTVLAAECLRRANGRIENLEAEQRRLEVELRKIRAFVSIGAVLPARDAVDAALAALSAIAKATSQQPQASPGNRKDGSSNLTAQEAQS